MINAVGAACQVRFGDGDVRRVSLVQLIKGIRDHDSKRNMLQSPTKASREPSPAQSSNSCSKSVAPSQAGSGVGSVGGQGNGSNSGASSPAASGSGSVGDAKGGSAKREEKRQRTSPAPSPATPQFAAGGAAASSPYQVRLKTDAALIKEVCVRRCCLPSDCSIGAPSLRFSRRVC
jgi:hypothetical protein